MGNDKGKEKEVNLQGILPTIRGPADVKKLKLNELSKLSAEIRDFLVDRISKNGGHLSPNLGVVELSIALHYVFNSPKDKLLFDTGHQSYVHKILTGRSSKFEGLRKQGGIAGFPDPAESEHDQFITGHASPSISQAIGMALARDLKKESNHVVAIIGDGALTGGVALEGLNFAGYKQTKVIIVINDNKMSYNQTVGAIQAYNNRLSVGNNILSTPIYHQVRGDIHLLLDNIPKEKEELTAAVRRLREAALSVLTPGIVFEELGYTYFGPLDGHNLSLLIDTFKKAALIKGPVIVHVITQKGKGCEFAESDQDVNGKYHGLGQFDPESGDIVKKSNLPAYADIFCNKLMEQAKVDPRIVAMTAAMPIGTGLLKFSKEFPDRFLDVGIAEQNGVTIASGLAKAGMRPVVAIYSSFLARAYDEVIYEVCLQNLPVTFVMNNAGLVDDNATQQGPFDIAYMRMIPNMVSMAPKDEHELSAMLDFAHNHNGPISIRFPKASASGAPAPKDLKIEMGKGKIEVQNGDDLAIFAYGAMVETAIKAAEQLKKEGIMVTVVNGRFAKPMDEKLLKAVAAKCGKVITIEEGTAIGGFGSGVAELFKFNGLADIQMKILGIPDQFLEHGLRSDLLKQIGLSSEGIVQTAKELLGTKQ